MANSDKFEGIEEYLRYDWEKDDNKLWEIQKNMNILKKVKLTRHNSVILDIDFNTRSISAPKFLSVQKDHQAETVYFKFDRYFDMIDLTSMVCIVQYKNARGEEYFYPVPFYDIYSFANENKVIVPWCIQGAATVESGEIEFSLRFYRLDTGTKTITYSLNTLPAKSKILQGQNWNLQDLNEEMLRIDNNILFTIQQIADSKEHLALPWVTLIDD